ncbi:hypothetical protein C8R46DRAFT_1356554 [Mycena filopes]|nr:hypothetical protein C8R46DRAFT_1356554 [Mycena filopes]
MPRVASTSSTRAQGRNLSTGRKLVPPSPPLKFPCTEMVCLWSFKRSTDLTRHAARHMAPEERANQMIACPQPDCGRTFLQKSNMETHFVGQHTGLKPHFCTQCAYCCADPSSLHRHMRRVHAYVPGAAPRKKRSAAASLLDGLAPAVPSPGSTSDSSAASSSTNTVEEASRYSSPASPSAASPSNTPDDSSLDHGLSSPASMDSFLPASPTNPGSDADWAWAWDPSFEAACLPELEPTASPLLAGAVNDYCFDPTSVDAVAASLFFQPSLPPYDASHLDLDFGLNQPLPKFVFDAEWSASFLPIY